jgi:hypothetical protein
MYSEKAMKQLSVGLLIILSIILMVTFSGCENLGWKNPQPEPNTVSQPIEIKQLGTSTESYDRYYQIYTLEGCEYIVVSPGNSHFTWGTHKGNCKNRIHEKSK